MRTFPNLIILHPWNPAHFFQGSNSIAIAYDDGTVMVKVGREEPVASMDSSGKIIWARHNGVQTVNIKVCSELRLIANCRSAG